MNKKTAVALAVLLTLVVLGTFVSLLMHQFNPVIKVTGLLLGFLTFIDLNLICGVLAGSYDK